MFKFKHNTFSHKCGTVIADPGSDFEKLLVPLKLGQKKLTFGWISIQAHSLFF